MAQARQYHIYPVSNSAYSIPLNCSLQYPGVQRNIPTRETFSKISANAIGLKGFAFVAYPNRTHSYPFLSSNSRCLVLVGRICLSITDIAVWRRFQTIQAKIQNPRGYDNHQRHPQICGLSWVRQSLNPYLRQISCDMLTSIKGFSWHRFSFRRGAELPEGENPVGRGYKNDSRSFILEREGSSLGHLIEGNFQGYRRKRTSLGWIEMDWHLLVRDHYPSRSVTLLFFSLLFSVSRGLRWMVLLQMVLRSSVVFLKQSPKATYFSKS